ncbi:hypothetical protein R3P38DRAFT_3245238, partial [Favolaschia claudopus]
MLRASMTCSTPAFTSLIKIYTLPNIEISEAFLKLREQARCHYQKPNDLAAGRPSFYTLKGMFHARAKRNEDANNAFGQAVQLDMTQAKAWAEWGRFNDNMFKGSASRPLLVAISKQQWLLSVDDNTLAISRAFDTYKGDAAYWYWITSIPHL